MTTKVALDQMPLKDLAQATRNPEITQWENLTASEYVGIVNRLNSQWGMLRFFANPYAVFFFWFMCSMTYHLVNGTVQEFSLKAFQFLGGISFLVSIVFSAATLLITAAVLSKTRFAMIAPTLEKLKPVQYEEYFHAVMPLMKESITAQNYRQAVLKNGRSLCVVDAGIMQKLAYAERRTGS